MRLPNILKAPAFTEFNFINCGFAYTGHIVNVSIDSCMPLFLNSGFTEMSHRRLRTLRGSGPNRHLCEVVYFLHRDYKRPFIIDFHHLDIHEL